MRGRKSHGRPVYLRYSGGSNLGGEQIYGPEDKQIIAASSVRPHRNCRVGIAKRRPAQNSGKAVVLWEEMGKCTTGAAGVGIQARRERFTEITPGRSYFQQGLTATCKDPLLRFIQGGGRI